MAYIQAGRARFEFALHPLIWLPQYHQEEPLSAEPNMVRKPNFCKNKNVDPEH